MSITLLPRFRILLNIRETLWPEILLLVMIVQKKTRNILKKIAFHTPFKDYLIYRHGFNFTIPQLFFLCQCVEEVREVNGAIAEVGCAYGRTTVFLNKFMDSQKIEKKYFAVDTFSGFVSEDVNYEVSKRQKERSQYSDAFQGNTKKWFDYTMERNGISRVTSIQTDVNSYDLRTLGPLSFVLLDVDLYRPIKKSLPELYEALSPKGIIVVDDCDARSMEWDGSDQAYKEFVKEINHPIEIVHDKLGIVRKL